MAPGDAANAAGLPCDSCDAVLFVLSLPARERKDSLPITGEPVTLLHSSSCCKPLDPSDLFYNHLIMVPICLPSSMLTVTDIPAARSSQAIPLYPHPHLCPNGNGYLANCSSAPLILSFRSSVGISWSSFSDRILYKRALWVSRIGPKPGQLPLTRKCQETSRSLSPS